MAPQQADLHDIGREGFAIIEQHFVKRAAKPYPPQKSRAPQHSHQIIIHRKPHPICHYGYQPQESLVYHTPRVPSSEVTVITAHEPSMLHDAAVFMDFQRRRPTRMAF
ncbi:hypothetical protein C2S52_014450 [Perilla frutescens var. hirtella]|uniref:Uncharacterized protein n=1 Tax=Perilla frutescens var. hirtella TaxID=608512 RepID=A0AAD4JDL6_PERFH|nr:hypothetical protein C2S52_014450 [Perilla frutescens var. hirtella]KAH6831886.1 hypothetical protein C2S53_012761 [Perilla frutescens var. hirtella]